MDRLFLLMINMSITSSYVILFVIAARFFLKKAPKLFSYALWAIPFLRLVFPFSFESTFSLVSINREIIPENIVSGHTPPIQSAISTIDGAVNYIPQAADSPLSSAFYLPLPSEVNPIQRWISLGSTIWIIGLLLLLVLSVYSTIRLSRRLKSASLIRDNIYSADHIETAFVFGLLRPRIFLPCNLSQTEALYVIRHEEIHIRRLDHLVKFLASLIVSIHWFNPLVWLAFYLMGVDMELSCDESVINEMGYAARKDYSSSLLSLSTGKRRLVGSPLAFSENNTKGRIKNILNYEKPKFWIVIVSIIFVAVLTVGLLSNRPQKQKENPNASLSSNNGMTEETTTEDIVSKTDGGTAIESPPGETTEDSALSDIIGEVSYLVPKIQKDTNLGADLPFIHFETEDQVIFSSYLGIFIFDLNDSEMLRAFIPSDSNLRIGAQGDTISVVRMDKASGIITIHNVGMQLLDYYYQYDLQADKLYRYLIEDLPDIEPYEVSGEMNTSDWTAWNLTYTSRLTGKTYYPLRNVK